MSDLGRGLSLGGFVYLVAAVLLLGRLGIWAQSISALPACIDGEHQLQVRVLSRARSALDRWRLETQITRSDDAACPALVRGKLRLNWYERSTRSKTADVPVAGDVWLVNAVLRRPWGTRNPGGFDYGLWLHGKGFVATGWIRNGQLRDRPLSNANPVAGMHLLVNAQLLQALALGDRVGVSEQHWSLFRATGTLHLMVVSGLHVGVVAGLSFALCLWAGRIAGVSTGWLEPRRLGLLGSMAAVLTMVWLTGAHPPVVRAGLMALLIGLCSIRARRFAWWQGLLWVGWLAVMLQPRIVLQQGFWLSYGAVVVLLVGLGPVWRRVSWVRSLLRAQVCLTLGMAPLIGFIAGELPAVSPVANMVAVPLVTLLALPCALAGYLLLTILPWAGPGFACLRVADFSLSVMLRLLEQLSSLLPTFGYLSGTVALLAGAAYIVMVLPLGTTVRMVALLGWAPVLLPNTNALQSGQFRVIVLDVGQGSAAIVDTRDYRLVVDTGAAFESGFSMAEAVVLPAVLRTGPRRLHDVLISHFDNDHAGGLPLLRQRWPALHQVDCRRRSSWLRNGVLFQTLLVRGARSRNDGSCTLLITADKAAVYFSGDIGRQAEARLVPQLRQLVPDGVDVLIVPHHGSKSSSSELFLRQLQPRYSLISAGRNNRYGHPHTEVAERYRRRGSSLFITAAHGALTWCSCAPARLDAARQGNG